VECRRRKKNTNPFIDLRAETVSEEILEKDLEARCSILSAIRSRGSNLKYLFEGYVLDLQRRELRLGDQLIPVEPQVFDVLDYLIRNRDKVVTKDDIFAAVWQGRIVSETALTSRINAARAAIGDTGEDQHLIRTLRGKGYRFVGAVQEKDESVAAVSASPVIALSRPALTLPDRPSIAVLPFTNMSGDPQQDYFADGITEDIITALARFKSLFVIARNSSFAYRDKGADISQVAGELGVRYVLEGSIRKSGERVRVAGQLIDAATNGHIWAERYDRRLTDIFDLQDEITEQIVGAVEPQVVFAEVRRARSKRPDNLEAYDYVLKAYQHLFLLTLHDNEQALENLRHAMTLSPYYALAYAYASWANLFRVQLIQSGSIRPIITEAVTFAQRAAELDPADPLIQTIRAAWQMMVDRDYDGALARHEQAFQENPNSVWICGCNGFGNAVCRHFDRAIEMLNRARRLSPIDPSMFLWLPGGAIAHLLAGRPEEAIRWTEEALRLNPRHLISLFLRAAAEVAAERSEVARQFVGRIREINPALDLKFAGKMLPFKHHEDKKTILGALTAAGLPD
jgi:TolB-like protein